MSIWCLAEVRILDTLDRNSRHECVGCSLVKIRRFLMIAGSRSPALCKVVQFSARPDSGTYQVWL